MVDAQEEGKGEEFRVERTSSQTIDQSKERKKSKKVGHNGSLAKCVDMVNMSSK